MTSASGEHKGLPNALPPLWFHLLHRWTYFKVFLSRLEKSQRSFFIEPDNGTSSFPLLSGIQIRSKAAATRVTDSWQFETQACNMNSSSSSSTFKHIYQTTQQKGQKLSEEDLGVPLPQHRHCCTLKEQGTDAQKVHHWSPRESTELVFYTDSLSSIPTLHDLCQTMTLINHHEETNSSSDKFPRKKQFNLKSCCFPVPHFFYLLFLRHFQEIIKSVLKIYYLLKHIRDKLKVMSFAEWHRGLLQNLTVSWNYYEEYGIWKNMKFKGELSLKVRNVTKKPN